MLLRQDQHFFELWKIFYFQRTSLFLLFEGPNNHCADDDVSPTPSPSVEEPTTGYIILIISVKLSESNCNLFYFCHSGGDAVAR